VKKCGSSIGLFDKPYGISVDSEGVIYVADTYNGNIKKLCKDGTLTVVNTDYQFDSPYGVAIASNKNLWVTDFNRNQVGKVSPDGHVRLIDHNKIISPCGVAVDQQDQIYVASYGGHTVLKITNDCNDVTVLAGGDMGYQDGHSSDAKFSSPYGLAVDDTGIYVTDRGNSVIRKIQFELNWSPSRHKWFSQSIKLSVKSGMILARNPKCWLHILPREILLYIFSWLRGYI